MTFRLRIRLLKVLFTLDAPKPPIISTNSVPATLKNGTFASLATALAII